MKRFVVLAAFILMSTFGAKAQSALPTPTSHGLDSTWTAATPGSNPIAGYNIWRCTGDATVCTATSTNWTKLNTTPISGLSYLDPASGLSVNTTYSYVLFTQDTQGELSVPSNIATVTVGATFPTSPTAPGNLTTVQK